MPGSPSDAVRDTAARLVLLPENDFVPALNEALRELFPGFHIDSAAIRDSAGSQTPVFQTVLSVTPIEAEVANADGVACVAYVCQSVDETKLREAYDRIAQAKSLKKAPPKKPEQSTVTVGLVIAAQSAVSLSRLAEQIKDVTVQFPHNRHADMIAVLSRGVIGYCVRFPGDRGLMERLPSPDEVRPWAASTLTHLVSTATMTYALNQVVGYMTGQLAFFAPGKTIPDMKAILEGVPETRNILATYQETLSGKLAEINEVLPIERPLYIVESDKGELLTRLYYQPWQDGGVIHSEGRLPLEGLLPLMQIGSTMVFRPTPTRQISAVLALSLDDFKKAVEEIPKA